MALHPDTDDGKFANVVGGDDFGKAELGFERVDHFSRLKQVRLVHGKR